MAKTMQELVGMESPFEASLKAVGYKEPETKEQKKYIEEKSKADIDVAKGKTKISEESLKTKEELYARPDLQKQKIEAFAPTPESGSDLAKLFALTTAITFFGGGKGRYSGQAAMGNLASAMDGYKKGRKDLFAQEMKEYDKNMKSAMENNKLIEDKLKEYLDLSTKKDELALVKLAEVQALTARQGGLAQIEKMSGENLAKHAETLGKARADWIKHVMDIQNKAADRDAAAFEIYQDKDGNLVRVNKRTGAAQPIADSQGLVKPGKALTDKQSREVEGLDSLSKGLEQLRKDFKPEFASFGVLGFGADLEYEAKRRLGDKKGQEAISWWSKYERLQAPNRHALFGATLTGNELKNYQSFTAKKSDSPETVKTFLDDQIAYSNSVGNNKRLVYKAAGYKVPEAKARDFVESFSGGDTSKFQQEAIKRFGTYEPEKYDYGFEDNKFYRDEK